MTDKEAKQILKVIDSIEKRLDAIEDVMSFMIKASQRFKKGNRVEFNARADKSGVSSRTKGRVRTGTVLDVDDGWSVKVLLDGYKRPHSYHHSFFDKVKRKR